MRCLILVLLLTVPCLALADEDDPFGDDFDDRSSASAPAQAESPQPAPTPVADQGPATDAPRQLDAEAAPARGGPVGILISPRDPAANEAAVAFERKLSEALGADGRLQPVSILRKLGGSPDPQTRPDVQVHLDAGKLAYDNLELETAAQEYLTALKMMLERPENVLPAKVAHGFTLAGAAYLLNGDTDRASKSFRRAALLAPGFVPPPTDFSPDIIEAFQAEKAATLSGPKGTLTVTSNVSPAVVLLGGREAGIAPVKLDGLPAGRHHVLVVSRAHRPWATFVEVGENGAETLSAQMEPLPTAEPLARAVEMTLVELPAGGMGSGARELANLLEVPYLVFGTARSDAAGTLVEYHAFDARAGRLASSGKKAVVPESPAFEADISTLAPELTASLLNPPVLAAAEAPSGPLTQRWWFWPAVGGVAAAAVGAATFAIVTASSGPTSAPTLFITGIP